MIVITLNTTGFGGFVPKNNETLRTVLPSGMTATQSTQYFLCHAFDADGIQSVVAV
jgi:hypothetical protein